MALGLPAAAAATAAPPRAGAAPPSASAAPPGAPAPERPGCFCPASCLAALAGLARRARPGRGRRRAAGAAGAAARAAGAAGAPFPGRVRGLLFDIDGTLADSDPIHFGAFVDVLAEAGFNGGEPITEAFFRERITGRTNRDICRDLFPDWSEQRAAAFSDRKEAMFRERAAGELAPTPGLDGLLAWCDARGLRTAAVTNAPRLNAEFILRCINRSTWFEHLIIGDECARGKPEPDPYLEAMSRAGLSPAECVAFEDSPSGARAAVAAGVYTVGILSGQRAERLREAGCGMLVESFDDERLWRALRAAVEG